jgi:AraC-like DNA-binding protein
MESDRCKTIVKTELSRLGIRYKSIEIGEVELEEDVSQSVLQIFNIALKAVGLEIIFDKRIDLNEKVKKAIHELVYDSDDIPKPKISEYISEKVGCDYTSLSNTFREMQGMTIEKYVITAKVKRAKELIVSAQHTLGDIAFLLQYSSVAHLSNQFKKETGFTPSVYRYIQSPNIPYLINV